MQQPGKPKSSDTAGRGPEPNFRMRDRRWKELRQFSLGGRTKVVSAVSPDFAPLRWQRVGSSESKLRRKFAKADRMFGCNGAVASVEVGNLCKQAESFATGVRPERQTEVSAGFGLSKCTAKPAPKGEFHWNMGAFRTVRSVFRRLRSRPQGEELVPSGIKERSTP